MTDTLACKINYHGKMLTSNDQYCKTFCGCNLQMGPLSYNESTFQLNLMFIGKARNLPYKGAPELPYQGQTL
jgi:hypothetical protein